MEVVELIEFYDFVGLFIDMILDKLYRPTSELVTPKCGLRSGNLPKCPISG